MWLNVVVVISVARQSCIAVRCTTRFFFSVLSVLLASSFSITLTLPHPICQFSPVPELVVHSSLPSAFRSTLGDLFFPADSCVVQLPTPILRLILMQCMPKYRKLWNPFATRASKKRVRCHFIHSFDCNRISSTINCYSGCSIPTEPNSVSRAWDTLYDLHDEVSDSIHALRLSSAFIV